MIKYLCDVTGRELTPEQVGHCQQTAQAFAQKYKLAAADFSAICTEFFHPDTEKWMEEYWTEKAKVLADIREQGAARLTNHRKEFFKAKRHAPPLKVAK